MWAIRMDSPKEMAFGYSIFKSFTCVTAAEMKSRGPNVPSSILHYERNNLEIVVMNPEPGRLPIALLPDSKAGFSDHYPTCL